MSYKLTVRNAVETFIKEKYNSIEKASLEFQELCRYYRCTITEELQPFPEKTVMHASNSAGIVIQLKLI